MITTVQKERVGKLVGKWKSRLLLNHWTFVVQYLDEELEPAPKTKTVASMVINDRYTEGRMTIYPRFWAESKAAQEATIVHELIHAITEPCRDATHMLVAKGSMSIKKWEDMIEQLTEHICKTVFKAYKKSCPEHII